MRPPFSLPSLNLSFPKALTSYLPRPADLESGSGTSSPSTSTCTTTSRKGSRNRTFSRSLMKRTSGSHSSSVSISNAPFAGRPDGESRATSWVSANADAGRAPSLPLLTRTGTITLDSVGVGGDEGHGRGDGGNREVKMQSLVQQHSEQDLGMLVSITEPASIRPPILDAMKAVEPSPRTSSKGFETVAPNGRSPIVEGEKGGQTGHKAAGCVKFENAKSKSALLQKYDPGPGIEVGKMWPMEEHRRMARGMFLDNILIAAANLQRHGWVLGSENERFKELHTPERWNMIHEDLMRYTKAVEAYETWRNSFMQTLEFGPSALPPSYGRYGLTLAIIECASRSKDLEELALVNQLSHELVETHANWSQSGSFARHVQDRSDRRLPIRNSAGVRIALATFVGLAFIFPMLIMVLDQTIASRLCTVTIFTFAVGWLLAYWMEDVRSTTIVTMTAAYAAVLVIFVGNGLGSLT